MKSIPSLLTILLSSLAAISQVTINAQLSHLPARDYRPQWLADTHVQRRTNLLKRWFANGPIGLSPEQRSLSSPFDTLQSPKQFKGCIDPSEPFQCPQSQRCIALQFICDGHPGDCPGNFDENEETCIAAKRPAKENIEKFFQAEYTLHGLQLFKFLFGEKIAKGIEENHAFWFDTLASAFSVSKNIRHFAEKTHMSSMELAHLQNVVQTIHDGQLEELPIFVQEAVNQGLASLIEKLYESGFIDQSNK